MEQPKFSGTQIEYLLWAVGRRVPACQKQLENRIRHVSGLEEESADNVIEDVSSLYLANIVVTIAKALNGSNNRYKLSTLVSKTHSHYCKEKNGEV